MPGRSQNLVAGASESYAEQIDAEYEEVRNKTWAKIQTRLATRSAQGQGRR